MSLSVQLFYKVPPNGCFSPQYPIIGGKGASFKNIPKTDDLYLKIKFLKKLDKVDTIKIIFSGEIRITYEDFPAIYTIPLILTEELSLFNFTQTLFDKPNSTFEKDEIILLKCKDFKFPFDEFRLPSSYYFMSTNWIFSIDYWITVDLQRSKLFHKHNKCRWTLDYQSGYYFDLDRNLNYLDSNTSLKERNSHCFRKKPKRFILAEGNNLVENPLNSSHRHTRIFRSMFNDNFKKLNYKSLTKDVDLILKFKPNSFINNLTNSFDINNNFISQLGVLRIETNSILNNNLVPDYVINNKSTELGKFHFKYLKIYMIDHLKLHCKGEDSFFLKKKTALIDTLVYKRQDETVAPQFINGYNNDNNTDDINDISDATSSNFSISTANTLKIDRDKNDISISFDLCNFKQDPQNKKCYFTEFNISELLKSSSSSVSFPKPILSSFDMPNYFENDVSIEIKIGIASRFKGKETTKRYKLRFGAILTNNSRLHVPQPQPLSNPPQYSEIFDSSEIGN
ncbi:unnamed protein product [[Candida] boidinii]|nr:hypothetical protein BVG19_g1817 [[Candida] boidinii]OWB53164.1 hypothetical protein B5S27_g4756 [[Candida] boidinii]GME87407.1 unnamed protein product [[Candida] boidinii]